MDSTMAAQRMRHISLLNRDIIMLHSFLLCFRQIALSVMDSFYHIFAEKAMFFAPFAMDIDKKELYNDT
jgi:hypothetical protein